MKQYLFYPLLLSLFLMQGCKRERIHHFKNIESAKEKDAFVAEYVLADNSYPLSINEVWIEKENYIDDFNLLEPELRGNHCYLCISLNRKDLRNEIDSLIVLGYSYDWQIENRETGQFVGMSSGVYYYSLDNCNPPSEFTFDIYKRQLGIPKGARELLGTLVFIRKQ